jgi:hypothetical protein
MKFNPDLYRQERWKFYLVAGTFMLFAFVLIWDAFKTREDFKVISGQVIEEGNTKIKMIRGNNYSDAYYFRLTNHGQLFGVATDKNGVPTLDESFKGLNVGDIVKVTYEENWATDNERVNLVVHEIVRADKVLYDNIPTTYWNGRMRVGLVCLTIGLSLIGVVVSLNKKYQRLTLNN